MMLEILKGGLQSLQDYIAYHVLTCLIPAFLLAGGMVSFVSKEAIIRYLGIAARRLTSYILAAISSFLSLFVPARSFPFPAGSIIREPEWGPPSLSSGWRQQLTF